MYYLGLIRIRKTASCANIISYIMVSRLVERSIWASTYLTQGRCKPIVTAPHYKHAHPCRQSYFITRFRCLPILQSGNNKSGTLNTLWCLTESAIQGAPSMWFRVPYQNNWCLIASLILGRHPRSDFGCTLCLECRCITRSILGVGTVVSQQPSKRSEGGIGWLLAHQR